MYTYFWCHGFFILVRRLGDVIAVLLKNKFQPTIPNKLYPIPVFIIFDQIFVSNFQLCFYPLFLTSEWCICYLAWKRRHCRQYLITLISRPLKVPKFIHPNQWKSMLPLSLMTVWISIFLISSFHICSTHSIFNSRIIKLINSNNRPYLTYSLSLGQAIYDVKK